MKSRVTLWRLGTLDFTKQSYWPTAPAKRGLWAFPWPYFDESFAFHQYEQYMPKNLRYRRSDGDSLRLPFDTSWLRLSSTYGISTPFPEGTQFAVNGRPLGYKDDDYFISLKFYEAREQWVETVGRKRFPRRKFSYEGLLYTHLRSDGLFGEIGDRNVEPEWHHISSAELAKRLKKFHAIFKHSNAGAAFNSRLEGDFERNSAHFEHSHLEVFIAAGEGKITSPRS